MKYCGDAGHGGRYNHAISYDGVQEKSENLTNALAFETEMNRRGHSVVLTRRSDKDFGTPRIIDLQARADIANSAKVDGFISFHENGYDDPNANGIEVIYGTDASQKSIQWANDCLNRLVQATGLRRRRTFAQGLVVLNDTKMPAILVELGFMSNKHDMDTIRQKRKAAISAIADSCEAIFGKAIQPKPVDPFAYELSANAPLFRYVGEGKQGTPVKLGAYPILEEKPIIDDDENGVFAKISDSSGNIYLVPWIYLSKVK